MASRVIRILDRRRAKSPAGITRGPADEIAENPLGLRLLWSPEHPCVDFVFVHGLGGGSVKTWCKGPYLDSFWPKNWIVKEVGIEGKVRTFSFGYAADWKRLKPSKLSVSNFGRDLLHQLETSPDLNRGTENPVVLIGHSMGGLVIKKAYLIAHSKTISESRRNNEGRKYIHMKDRIKCMVFLGTPHRGAGSADILERCLGTLASDKEYVADLKRYSQSLQAINDAFMGIYDPERLQLWSFYETIGYIGASLIVKQDSAVLGLPGEQATMLYANHRDMCKFSNRDDSNYINLKNTLVAITRSLVTERTQADQAKAREQIKSIETYLNVFHIPETDFERQLERRIRGSCEWIENRTEFRKWSIPSSESSLEDLGAIPNNSNLPGDFKTSGSSLYNIYWLTGRPGAGKSVCAAHVVDLLRARSSDCSYYFFQHGHRAKEKISGMLRSIALQMAEMHQSVRNCLFSSCNATRRFDWDDSKITWKKLFTQSIFELSIPQPQYWVIDGLDECVDMDNFFSWISTTECSFDLRIFITSRSELDLKYRINSLKNINLTTHMIQTKDTQDDMRTYLNFYHDHLPVQSAAERDFLRDELVKKANDSFLWLRLVTDELKGTFSKNSTAKLLDSVPEEMTKLYSRSFQDITDNQRELKLFRALFMWTACSLRPLKLDELQSALDLYDEDSDIQGSDLRRCITKSCEHLIYIDKNDYVQFVHTTVREFLLHDLKRCGQETAFSFTRKEGHERLAKACLKCLKTEMQAPQFQFRLSDRRETTKFVSYASIAFSDHISASSSKSDELFLMVYEFFSKHALAWIENVALEQQSLHSLIRTAKDLRNYLARRSKQVSPLGKEFKTIDDWTTDLIRLVAKFGWNLKTYPFSIYSLIPSISPKESRLFLDKAKTLSRVRLVGPAATGWDDCVSIIEYNGSGGLSLACGENVFAIGFRDGRVIIFDQTTCQERLRVQHVVPGAKPLSSSLTEQRLPTPVRLLALDSSDDRFVSASPQSICVWSIAGELLNSFALHEPCVSVAFSIDKKEILGVTRSSRITRWKIAAEEQHQLSVPNVHRRRLSTEYIGGANNVGLPRQAPLAAAISPDQTMLALLYRGRQIYLCSVEDSTVYGFCGRDVGSKTSNISVQTAIFNPAVESHLLAVAYQDGELAVYDARIQKELVSIDGDAYTLAASPDGRTLASGNNRGTIYIRDFETLALLYCIKSGLEEVKSIAFMGDGLRIVDIRDSRTKVWEPHALVRQNVDDHGSMSEATPMEAPTVGDNEEIVSITAMCSDESGDHIVAGQSDGSVVLHDPGTGLQASRLYIHPGLLFILVVAARSGVIASADAGGRIWVRKLSDDFSTTPLMEVTKSDPVQQLLLSEGATHLAVATSKGCAIWDLSTTQKISEQIYSQITPLTRRWLAKDRNLFAIMSDFTIHHYTWDSLDPLQINSSSVNIYLSQSHTQDIMQDAVATDDAIFVSVNSSNVASKTQVVGLATACTSGQVTRAPTHHAALKFPADLIKVFVGIYSTPGSDLAIFLNHELWICSLDVGSIERAGARNIRRHFFIPSDCLSALSGTKPMVTARGDIIIAKEAQLAIFKSDLNMSYYNLQDPPVDLHQLPPS